VVLVAQAHAVLDTPEQQWIPTMGDDVIHFGRCLHHTGTLAHMAQGIPA